MQEDESTPAPAPAPKEPESPSASAPGLSMNAFGRPKMSGAAVVAEEEDMDVDESLIAPAAEGAGKETKGGDAAEE